MKIIKLINYFLIFSSILIAQDKLPRLSPKAFVGQVVGYTTVKINYGSPGVKGRKIWGDLVPFGKVWRTGANEATTIEFDNDVLINGNKVKAGIYSLFTIPDKEIWTIILNKDYDQWGAFKYNKEDDVLRFKVKPKENSFYERLKFSIVYKEPYKSDIVLKWENLKISFEIDSTPIKESK